MHACCLKPAAQQSPSGSSASKCDKSHRVGGYATHSYAMRQVVPNEPDFNTDDQKRMLDRLVLDVLADLQAQETMVPGAKLRQEVVRAGWQQGLGRKRRLGAGDRETRRGWRRRQCSNGGSRPRLRTLWRNAAARGVEWRCCGCCLRLVDAGAKLEAKDAKGWVPMESARDGSHVDLMWLLFAIIRSHHQKRRG